MLKILQARLQQYMNHELPDSQAELATSVGSSKKQEFQKNIYFCFVDYTKAFDCVDHNKLENSSRDGNTRPPYLPTKKPYGGQEATFRTGHGTTDWFQTGKGVRQGCILKPCLPCLFNLCAEISCEMLG